jgi:hypothetical protein
MKSLIYLLLFLTALALPLGAATAATPAYTVVLLPDGKEIIISDFEDTIALLHPVGSSSGPSEGQECLAVRMYWNFDIWPAKVAAEGLGTLKTNASAAQQGKICPATNADPALFAFGDIERTDPIFSFYVISEEAVGVLRRYGIPTTEIELAEAGPRSRRTSATWLAVSMLCTAILLSAAMVAVSRAGQGSRRFPGN